MHKYTLHIGLPLAALAAAGLAHAQSGPTGVWIDHTGRGAVAITECGADLCGRLVWFKDGANKKACGTQIIGNAKPVGKGTWDGGWILDPETNSKYSVELKPIGSDKLQVLGYAGSKLFSETMIWKRAGPDLKRCDDAQPEVVVAPVPGATKPAPLPTGEAPPTAATKEADKGKAAGPPDADTGCKQFIPQIGKVMSVPCKQ